MATPIRTAWTSEGNIEAAYYAGTRIRRVVIDSRTGEVLEMQLNGATDSLRLLVRSAREALATTKNPNHYR